MRRFTAARAAAGTGAMAGIRRGDAFGSPSTGADRSRSAPLMPPLLPPVSPMALAPAITVSPTFASTTTGVTSETVEMPILSRPAKPLDRLSVIPTARPSLTPRRAGLGRLAVPRRRRDATRPTDLLPAGAELTRIEDMRRPFRRPMTVLVANPKGGSGKTPLTLLLAGTLALLRGGHVLAWDNNEARGGLAFRADPRGADRPGAHCILTVRDLLADLTTFESHTAGMGELAAYLRPQDELFDVLAADDDPTSLAQIRGCDFARLHAVLRRYYRILLLDSGNNVRSEAWQAAAMSADCLVLASNYDADSLAAAGWTLDHLAAAGRTDLVERAVTVLSAASGRPDPVAQAEARARFARTAEVVEIAHDPKLRSGERVGRSTVAPATADAVLRAAQAVVAQLCLVDAPKEMPVGATVPTTPGCAQPTPEFEEAAAEAVALVEHAARRAAAAHSQPVTAEAPPAEPAPPATESPSLEIEARPVKTVAAAEFSTRKRTTAPVARPTPADKPTPARSTAAPKKAASAASTTARTRKPSAAPTAQAVIAPRVAKEPKNTRRIAKPRTDAPVTDTPPVTDAPVTGAAPGEAVSTDVQLLFAAITAAGLPGAPGTRS